MKFFLSGWYGTGTENETALVERTPIKARCFSYWNAHPSALRHTPRVEEALHVCEEKKAIIMMDSGVFGLREEIRRAQNKKDYKAQQKLEDFKETMLEEYAKYVIQDGHLWDFYVTLDMARDAAKILEWHNRLEALGTRPTPVFHGDAPMKYMEIYRDKGYKRVCIGITQAQDTRLNKMRYLEKMFEFGAKYDIKYHGLAFTAIREMKRYPWDSVDSSTWSRLASMGCICIFDPSVEKMSLLHISVRDSNMENSFNMMSPEVKKDIRARIEKEGFDFDVLADSQLDRHIWNARAFQTMAEYATAYDKTKNVVWEGLLD